MKYSLIIKGKFLMYVFVTLDQRYVGPGLTGPRLGQASGQALRGPPCDKSAKREHPKLSNFFPLISTNSPHTLQTAEVYGRLSKVVTERKTSCSTWYCAYKMFEILAA